MDQLTQTETLDLAISGMTCASCVSRIEKVIGRVPGVSAVAVNLASESAHVTAVPGLEAAIEAAVKNAGYGAQLRATAKPYNGRRELVELVAAFVLAAPLFASMFLAVPGWVQFGFATILQFVLGARFYVAGYQALRAGAANMDVLVALGTSAAYGLSVADFFVLGGSLYFESSAAIIALIRLGKYFEGRAKRDAASAVAALTALRPATARRGGQDVPVAALRPGDVIDVRPGERLPADGVIFTGSGFFDESPVTGESQPVLRAPGASVVAGAMNLDATLQIKISSAPGESFLDRVARLIEAAQASKPAIQKLADRVAAIFVPAVLAIAALTAAGWLLAGAHPATAIINAVSVLVIACPCALGLATPAAILAGTDAAARNGILVRQADAFGAAARIKTVIFDKTGTLTAGTPKLGELKVLADVAEPAVRDIAAAMAAADTHPLAKALRLPGIAPAEQIRVHAGRGIEGVVAGTTYRMGSARMLQEAGIPVDAGAGLKTWSYLADDKTALAAFGFTDTLRPASKPAIQRLREMGIGAVMLSGDRQEVADAVAAELGIPEAVGGADPAAKLAFVQARRQAGGTGMVGDGINDAAALAAADVGIAFGTGADVAIEAADISLLRPDPMLVPAAIGLARKTTAILRQNLFWACAYNVVGIPAAAFGLLSPTIAGAAMAASSVCVLGNALRLKGWKP
jgi:Cu+-exporting ATPase